MSILWYFPTHYNLLTTHYYTMPQQYGLGRGLSSLIPQNKTTTRTPRKSLLKTESESYIEANPEMALKVVREEEGDRVREVAIDAIVPNPHQPRRFFSEEKLRELADSIKEKGVLQPLVVTEKNGEYELIAGERRLRASKLAGLTKVPVIVRKYEDQDKLEWAIIENIQRHNLSALEEARAYRKLADDFGLSQEAIARKMGKSRSSVANTIRLLALPLEVQRAIEEEKISEGHAKALLSVDNPEKQRALFERILKENLTVREVEEQSRSLATPVRSHSRTLTQDPQLKAIEDELHEVLGTKVRVVKQGAGAKVTIECYSKDDLVAIVNKMR